MPRRETNTVEANIKRAERLQRRAGVVSLITYGRCPICDHREPHDEGKELFCRVKGCGCIYYS
jgi:hypothetical protein